MCWVISTGDAVDHRAELGDQRLSACGPPVEEPISSARGALRAERRGASAAACAGTAGRRRQLDAADRGARRRAARPARLRRTLAPSWRIFSIRSRRKSRRRVTSRVLSGFGM